jgi:hypothetical protein
MGKVSVVIPVPCKRRPSQCWFAHEMFVEQVAGWGVVRCIVASAAASPCRGLGDAGRQLLEQQLPESRGVIRCRHTSSAVVDTRGQVRVGVVPDRATHA